MPFCKQHRLPLDKLFRFCGAETDRELAQQCNVHNQTIAHWRDGNGVPESRADEVAIHLGVHPSAIWGDAWFELAFKEPA
jgi:hypothetical protein